MSLDLDTATKLLAEVFEEAETTFQEKNPPALNTTVQKALDNLFSSNTQAYREVLIGSLLVRYQDKSIDLHLPYVKHGKNAYNARDLDERVINPFLKTKHIPSSKGPFLNVFRRGVRFTGATKKGVRDTAAYGSFLSMIEQVGTLTSAEDLRGFLKAVLYRFLQLREASTIEIAKVQRLSIPQYEVLIDGLLSIPSGGRFPVFVVVATLRAMKHAFALDWDIQHQGINVADAASEEPGDIKISRNGKTFIAAEVTLRIVDKARVVSTFTTKIVPAGSRGLYFLCPIQGYRSGPCRIETGSAIFCSRP